MRTILLTLLPNPSHLEKIVEEDDSHRPVHRFLLQRTEYVGALRKS